MSQFFTLLLLLACPSAEPEFTEYTVVRGDTLFVIARDHGVGLDELRTWNALEGDLIEVGQVLRIGSPGPSPIPATTSKRTGARSSGTPAGSAEPSLPSPVAEPCLPPPSGDELGDEGTIASEGLSHAQVSAGMNQIIGHTLRCVPHTSGRVETTLNVGCNGLVKGVVVSDVGPYDQAAIDCIVEILRHGDFDAHQLPDGMSFHYPLVYSF